LLRAVWDAASDAKMANPPYDTFSDIKPPRHITAGWNFGEAQLRVKVPAELPSNIGFTLKVDFA
jgi:hypothetical protein